jgi:hypothetical protein
MDHPDRATSRDRLMMECGQTEDQVGGGKVTEIMLSSGESTGIPAE